MSKMHFFFINGFLVLAFMFVAYNIGYNKGNAKGRVDMVSLVIDSLDSPCKDQLLKNLESKK